MLSSVTILNAGGGISAVLDFLPLNKQRKLNVKYICNSYVTAIVDESEELSSQ